MYASNLPHLRKTVGFPEVGQFFRKNPTQKLDKPPECIIMV